MPNDTRCRCGHAKILHLPPFCLLSCGVCKECPKFDPEAAPSGEPPVDPICERCPAPWSEHRGRLKFCPGLYSAGTFKPESLKEKLLAASPAKAAPPGEQRSEEICK